MKSAEVFSQELKDRISKLSKSQFDELWKGSGKSIGFTQFKYLSLSNKLSIISENQKCHSLTKVLRPVSIVTNKGENELLVALGIETPREMLEELLNSEQKLVRFTAFNNLSKRFKEYQGLERRKLESLINFHLINGKYDWGYQVGTIPYYYAKALLPAGFHKMPSRHKVTRFKEEYLLEKNPEVIRENWESFDKYHGDRCNVIPEMTRFIQAVDFAFSSAANINTPPDILAVLSKGLDWRSCEEYTDKIRTLIVSNIATPSEVLDDLSKLKSVYLMPLLISHPNLSEEAKKRIYERCTYALDLYSASLPDKNKLLELAQSNDENILFQILCNKSSSRRVIESISEKVTDTKDKSILYVLARNIYTPEQIIIDLSKHKEEIVRRGVAENDNCPKETLQQLINDKSEKVFFTAFLNHIQRFKKESLPKSLNKITKLIESTCLNEEIFTALNNSQNEAIKDAAMKNKSNPKWIESLDNASLDNFWLKRQLEKETSEARAAFQEDNVFFFHGKNPNKSLLSRKPLCITLALSETKKLDPKRISTVSKSKDWLVRAAVAMNPLTHKDDLERLAQDSNQHVSSLAKKSLKG